MEVLNFRCEPLYVMILWALFFLSEALINLLDGVNISHLYIGGYKVY